MLRSKCSVCTYILRAEPVHRALALCRVSHFPWSTIYSHDSISYMYLGYPPEAAITHQYLGLGVMTLPPPCRTLNNSGVSCGNMRDSLVLTVAELKALKCRNIGLGTQIHVSVIVQYILCIAVSKCLLHARPKTYMKSISAVGKLGYYASLLIFEVIYLGPCYAAGFLTLSLLFYLLRCLFRLIGVLPYSHQL